MITVIDNFLDDRSFHDISIIVGHEVNSDWQTFPMFWNRSVGDRHDTSIQGGYFTHIFYDKDLEDPNNALCLSDYSGIADLIINKYLTLDKALVKDFTNIKQAKVNFFSPTENLLTYGFHQDIPVLEHNSLIFYLNDCDGYTMFSDGTRVRSKKNRAVIITDGQDYEHASTNCTDASFRAVINIVFKRTV